VINEAANERNRLLLVAVAALEGHSLGEAGNRLRPQAVDVTPESLLGPPPLPTLPLQFLVFASQPREASVVPGDDHPGRRANEKGQGADGGRLRENVRFLKILQERDEKADDHVHVVAPAEGNSKTIY
jgi:hypothetical protein